MIHVHSLVRECQEMCVIMSTHQHVAVHDIASPEIIVVKVNNAFACLRSQIQELLFTQLSIRNKRKTIFIWLNKYVKFCRNALQNKERKKLRSRDPLLTYKSRSCWLV